MRKFYIHLLADITLYLYPIILIFGRGSLTSYFFTIGTPVTRRPTFSPIINASVLPSMHVKTLGIRKCNFEAVPALQGERSPLRPTKFSAYV